MPKITVIEPFNYRLGHTVEHYGKGQHAVPKAVADHAKAHGFIAPAKVRQEPKEEATQQ